MRNLGEFVDTLTENAGPSVIYVMANSSYSTIGMPLGRSGVLRVSVFRCCMVVTRSSPCVSI